MIVDMHAHYVSPALIAAAEAHGERYGVSIATLDTGLKQLTFTPSGERLRPFLPELISLELRKPWLAKHNIDVQVVSTWTDMNGDDLPIEQSTAWVRLQNETLAADVRTSGGRYFAMGTLSLGSVDLAVAELDYISRHLGLRAIELGTNFNGIDLDDAQFRPVWRKIADLGMLVLLHPPFKPVGLERAHDYFLNNLISYPVDTTIAAARLIFSGILDEFPGLNVCLAHAGGFLPYQIGRMNCGFGSHPACSRAITKAPDQYLRSFFYDTLTHDDAALDYLSRRVGNDRLFYGSDYPFEMLDASGPARVKSMSGTAAADIAAILSGNICDVMDIATSETARLTSA